MRALLHLSALGLVASVAASQRPIQVYLHPAPSALEPYHAPVLTAAQAQAVFSHHLGHGSVDEYEIMPDGKEGWVHLLGDSEVAEGDKGRVVFIQGDIDAQDILPPTISPHPTFYLSATSGAVKTFLQPYINRAEQVVDHILDGFEGNRVVQWLGDVFTKSGSQTSKILHDQLDALSALASRIPWTDQSNADHPWEAIIVDAFTAEDAQPLESEVREAACLGVKGALAEMTSSDGPPLVLVIMPARASSVKRAVDAETVLDELDTAEPVAVSYANSSAAADADPTCFPSNRTCAYASSSCAGHGTCVMVGNSTDSRTGECWACRCSSGYVGVQCQKGDYVFQTILLVFTPLLLLTVLVASVGLLSGIGGEKLPSTLNLSMGSGHKRD